MTKCRLLKVESIGLNFISLYKCIHITTNYKHLNKSLLIYTKGIQKKVYRLLWTVSL